MANRETAPPVDPRVAALLGVAAELRDLPRADFRERLKAELQRSTAAPAAAASVPAGHHTATPCLVVRDAPRAIEFYKQAFGATELMRLTDPGGKILHAEIQIGDSPIAISDEFPELGNPSPQLLGGSSVIMQIHVDDVDALATQAVAAGATVVYPIADQFYGDRAGRLADPFGHLWIVATHKEDVSAEEVQRRADAWADKHVAATAAPSYRVEPYLAVRGAGELIDFLKQAFAAEERSRATRPDGSIVHAEVTIGDSPVAVGDAEATAMPTAIHLYVPDTDAVHRRALQAGAIELHPPMEQDYGERSSAVKDACGNHWYIATNRGESYVPQGLHTVNSYLHPHRAPQLIEFLERAFGGKELFRAQSPDGVVHHAKVRIGESVVEMGEAQGPYQPMPTAYHLYVDDADAAYRRAVGAGGVSLDVPTDRPWGFRNAGVRDPAGNQWWINAPLETTASSATHVAPVASTSDSLTPFLHVADVRKTVDVLHDAFGAELVAFDRAGDPPHDHADVRIGDSMVMVGELTPGFAPTTSAFYLTVSDVDAVYQRALRAGLTSMHPPQDRPWGDRMAHVKDALGNSWFIGMRRADVARRSTAATGARQKEETMADTAKGTRANIIPTMRYRDAAAAIEWLCRAFGFEKQLVVPGEHGTIAHAQLKLGNGMIMLGSARDDEYGRLVQPPRDRASVNSQSPYIVVADADAHYRRAVAAGAQVVMDIKDEDYGGRGYTCRDPEGHVWNFGTYDPWA